MTNAERQFLWSQYPEVQEMFEEFNGLLLEDDQGWERLIKRSYEIRELHDGSELIEDVIVDAVSQLEKIAKKRRG